MKKPGMKSLAPTVLIAIVALLLVGCPALPPEVPSSSTDDIDTIDVSATELSMTLDEYPVL